jgi:hypothetical protein
MPVVGLTDRGTAPRSRIAPAVTVAVAVAGAYPANEKVSVWLPVGTLLTHAQSMSYAVIPACPESLLRKTPDKRE